MCVCVCVCVCARARAHLGDVVVHPGGHAPVTVPTAQPHVPATPRNNPASHPRVTSPSHVGADIRPLVRSPPHITSLPVPPRARVAARRHVPRKHPSTRSTPADKRSRPLIMLAASLQRCWPRPFANAGHVPSTISSLRQRWSRPFDNLVPSLTPVTSLRQSRPFDSTGHVPSTISSLRQRWSRPGHIRGS